jgi:hypothetical protein
MSDALFSKTPPTEDVWYWLKAATMNKGDRPLPSEKQPHAKDFQRNATGTRQPALDLEAVYPSSSSSTCVAYAWQDEYV